MIKIIKHRLRRKFEVDNGDVRFITGIGRIVAKDDLAQSARVV